MVGVYFNELSVTEIGYIPPFQSMPCIGVYFEECDWNNLSWKLLRVIHTKWDFNKQKYKKFSFAYYTGMPKNSLLISIWLVFKCLAILCNLVWTILIYCPLIKNYTGY